MIMLLIGIWISFTKKPMNPMIANPIAVAMAIFWNSFLSGLVHLLTSRIESFTNCRLGSTNCITWSMFVGWRIESVETRSSGENRAQRNRKLATHSPPIPPFNWLFTQRRHYAGAVLRVFLPASRAEADLSDSGLSSWTGGRCGILVPDCSPPGLGRSLSSSLSSSLNVNPRSVAS